MGNLFTKEKGDEIAEILVGKLSSAGDEVLDFMTRTPLIGYISSGVYFSRADDKSLGEEERDRMRAEAKRAAARATHATTFFLVVGLSIAAIPVTASFGMAAGLGALGGLTAEGLGILGEWLVEMSYTTDEIESIGGKKETVEGAGAGAIVIELVVGGLNGLFFGGTKFGIIKRYGAAVTTAAVTPGAAEDFLGESVMTVDQEREGADAIMRNNFVGPAAAPEPPTMVIRIVQTKNFMVRNTRAIGSAIGKLGKLGGDKIYRIITKKADRLNFLIDFATSQGFNALERELLKFTIQTDEENEADKKRKDEANKKRDLTSQNNLKHATSGDPNHRKRPHPNNNLNGRHPEPEVDNSTLEEVEQKVVDELARKRGPQKKHTFMLSVNGCIDPKGAEAVAASMHIASPFHERAYVTSRYSEHAFINFEDSQTDEQGVILKMLKTSSNGMTEDCYLSIDKSKRGLRAIESIYTKWETKRQDAAIWQVEIYQESFITFKLTGTGGSGALSGQSFEKFVGGYLAAVSEYKEDQLAMRGGVTAGRSGIHLAIIKKSEPTPSSFMVQIPPPDQFWWMDYKGKYQLNKFVPPNLEDSVPKSIVIVPSVEHDGMHMFVKDRRYDVIPQAKNEFIVYEEDEDRSVGVGLIPATAYQIETRIKFNFRTANHLLINTLPYVREWWWDAVGFYVGPKSVSVKIEGGKLMWVIRNGTKWGVEGVIGDTDYLITNERGRQKVTWDAGGHSIVGIYQGSDYHQRFFWEELVGRYHYAATDETGATVIAYATITMAIGLDHLHLSTPSGIYMKLEPWNLEELKVVKRNDGASPTTVFKRGQRVTDIAHITRVHPLSFELTLDIEGFGMLARG